MGSDLHTAETVLTGNPRSDGAGAESDHAVATHSLRPAGKPISTGTHATSQVSTPDEALLVDETRRMRVFAVFVLALVVLVAVLIEVIGGAPTARWIHRAGLAVGAIGALWFLGRTRDGTYGLLENAAFSATCVIAISTGFYYWGVFSAVLLMVPFGAFVLSMGRSALAPFLLTTACASIHTALSLALIFGAIDDPGLIQPFELSTGAQVVVLAIVQGIFFGSFALARSTRHSAVRAIEDLDHAVRALAVREALLAEAKQELEALMVGGPGRYTDQVIGSYYLGIVIGRGGMGEIYAATHEETGEPAAVKLLHPHVLANPKHIRRFLREVEIVASLDEPHIVRVLDVPSDGDPIPYLAMELLQGESLSQILKREHNLPVGIAVDMLRQIDRGLAAAHAAGVVHRDLKPQNLFLTETADGGQLWKILDFGVCKWVDEEGTLTQGALVGTPAYMAPEQARSADIDYRADIYAAGVIAYRALTGRPAFSGGGDLAAVVHDVAYFMPPRPSEVRPSLGPAIDAVFAIALAKRRDDRFGSVDELALALESASRDRLSPRIRERAVSLAREFPWRPLAKPVG